MQKIGISLEPKNLKGYGLQQLGAYRSNDWKTTFKDYFKFAFVRYPFDRLVSAYRNKLECDVNEQCFHNHWRVHYGTEIIKTYRKNASDLELRSGKSVKFREFLQYIIDGNTGRKFESNGPFNHHWSKYTYMYNFCDFDFDMIGRVETMATDVDYLISKLFPGKDSQLYIPHSNSKGRPSRNYYASIKKTTIQKISNIFADDFELFGYSKKLLI